MIQKLKKSNAGFTLVELLVVIAILGVLAAVLVPQYLQYVEKAREGTDKATFGEILHAAEVAGAQTGLIGTIQVSYTASDTIAISSPASGGAGADVATAMTAIIPTTTTLHSTAGANVLASAVTITITSSGATWTATTTSDAIAALG